MIYNFKKNPPFGGFLLELNISHISIGVFYFLQYFVFAIFFVLFCVQSNVYIIVSLELLISNFSGLDTNNSPLPCL